ncbi:hypothetical protein [Aestuariimicrobium ganziense]|uniref:hypothetical protein n=1 Tax=Aestuariimicrobium ganziense TaxID=2773677 RepID=UPI001942AC83|nr:hypothetical protein [Aestuariimicrobium ganziense]
MCDLEVDGAEGALPAGLSTPTNHPGTEQPGTGQPTPLLVFFHGGGFCLGDLDSYEAATRFL